MPQWKVELFAYGPVFVKGSIRLREPKGMNADDQFYSDIHLRSTPFGININLSARADTDKLAKRAALHYIGQALDVLALDIRQPLYISLHGGQPVRTTSSHVRRLVEKDEWHSAFDNSRQLNQAFPQLLRALSWYRKGLYTEDPFDKFLAFWNSIENVACAYDTSDACKNKGSKCHIWECFKLLWGEYTAWPVIAGQNFWIDENYEIRKDIAHGIAPVNVRRVEEVLKRLDVIEEVAYTFLTSWRSRNV